MPHPGVDRIPRGPRHVEGVIHNITAKGAVARVDILPLRGDGTTGGVVVSEVIPVPCSLKAQDGVTHSRSLRLMGTDRLPAVVYQV